MAYDIKTYLVYDVESYPNYFVLGFYEQLEDGTYNYKKIDGTGNYKPFLDYLALNTDSILFIGQNSYNYDNSILDFLLAHRDKDWDWLTTMVYQITVDVIEKNKKRWMVRREYNIPYNILGFDILEYSKKSLKANQVLHQHHRLETLPIAPGTVLSEEEKEVIGGVYLFNDCESTAKVFYDDDGDYTGVPMHVIWENRKALIDTFDIPKHDWYKSQSQLAIDVTTYDNRKRYTKFSKTWHYRCPVDLQFETDDFQNVLVAMENKEFRFNDKDWDNDFQLSIRVKDVIFEILSGGIHGFPDVPKGEAFVLTAEQVKWIVDLDLDSYYPTLIIVNGFHVDNFKVGEYSLMKDDRLRMKRSTDPHDKKMASAYKIVLNAIYGMMGMEFSAIYSPEQLKNVCFTGQLYLLKLVELLTLSGYKVFYANTDGITFYPENPTRPWEECVDDLIAIIGTEYGYETVGYDEVYARDVNNYMIKDVDGNWKLKGIAVLKAGKRNNAYHRVSYNAVIKFLQDGTPIEDTIYNTKDIREFILHESFNRSFNLYKVDKDFLRNGEDAPSEIYDDSGSTIVRWVVTEDSPYGLTKVTSTGGYNRINDSYGCDVIYDFDFDKEIEDYNLNYSFYLKKAYDILYTVANMYKKNDNLTNFIDLL